MLIIMAGTTMTPQCANIAGRAGLFFIMLFQVASYILSQFVYYKLGGATGHDRFSDAVGIRVLFRSSILGCRFFFCLHFRRLIGVDYFTLECTQSCEVAFWENEVGRREMVAGVRDRARELHEGGISWVEIRTKL